MKRRWWMASLLVVVAAAACSGDVGQSEDSANGAAVAATEAAEGAMPEEAVPPADAGVGGASSAEGGGAPALPVVATGAKVIKEGTVTIEIEDGRFDAAFAEVVQSASRLGGMLVASSTVSNPDAGEGGTSGTVTVRVPAEEYEGLLTAVTSIGTVRERHVTTQDVTAEFVDLESRLRHLEAQERFYLGLLEQAADVQDAIAVQQQLDGLQTEIERIKGRLQLLEDRTSLSTLTVELFESGGAPIDDAQGGDRPSLARYWQTAQDAFINVIGLMLVAGTFLLPLAAPVAIAFALFRLRRGPTTAPPAPAP